MKKILLASSIVLLLAACNNEEPNEGEPDFENDTDEEVEEEVVDEEESSSVETAQEVIEEAQSLHGDVISHEVVLTTEMSIGEEVTNSTSSTMIDEDENLQLQFTDSDGNVVSHYFLQDGNSFTHKNGEFTDLEVDISNEGASYGDLLETLSKFSDAELTDSTDGYTIVSQIDEISDLTAFTDENDVALFEERADEVTGKVEVNFDSNFVYTGATLDITIVTEESEIKVRSNIEVLNVGNIDFIVLPEGAPSDLAEDEATDDEEENGEETQSEEAETQTEEDGEQ